MLVFFRDGTVRKCSLKAHFEQDNAFAPLLRNPEYFLTAGLQPGGYAVEWDANMSIPDSVLYEMGEKVPLSASDFRSYVVQRVVNVQEAAKILGCSRQNIEYLTRTGKLLTISSVIDSADNYCKFDNL